MYSLHDDLAAEKIRSQKIAELFKKSPILYKSGLKIDHCCETLSFSCTGTGEPVLHRIFRCREKYCPACQRRKSLQAYAEGMKLAYRLAERHAFLHVVLTVRNCAGAELRATVQRMNAASSKLLRGDLCSSAFKGALRCLEVSVNTDTETYHPHFHILVAVNKSYFTSRYYIKQEQLGAAWAALIGQPSAVVHISKVKDPGAAIAEVCKYCTKPLEIAETKDLLRYYETLYLQTKHLRHIQAYGVVRDAARSLKIDFETLKTEWEGCDLSFDDFDDIGEIFGGGEFVYRWNDERKRFLVEK